MDTCICMTESLNCSSETIITLLIGYSPRLNKKESLKTLKSVIGDLKKRKKWQLFLHQTALCQGDQLLLQPEALLL